MCFIVYFNYLRYFSFRTNKITRRSIVLPEKLKGPQSRNCPYPMKSKDSLSHSQDLSPVPVLIQSKPVHASTNRFLNIHFNIILPSMPRSSSGLPPSELHTKSMYVTLLYPTAATRPAHHSS